MQIFLKHFVSPMFSAGFAERGKLSLSIGTDFGLIPRVPMDCGSNGGGVISRRYRKTSDDEVALDGQ